MGWRNINVRKQILKAFFLRSIRNILIMNHVNVVLAKSWFITQYFGFTLISPYSQEINYAALICVTLISLWANNRRHHSLTYSPGTNGASISLHLSKLCPETRLLKIQLTSQIRSHNLQFSNWGIVFWVLVLLNFKAIKVSLLNVNTTNKLSFVDLNLQGLSRNSSLVSTLA